MDEMSPVRAREVLRACGKPLFPNVRSIRMCIRHPTDAELLLLLIGPKLQELHVRIWGVDRYSPTYGVKSMHDALDDVFARLLELEVSLQEFSFHTEQHYPQSSDLLRVVENSTSTLYSVDA